MGDEIVKNTPWEVYSVNGRDVIVKREDLCCPYPGPSFSKIRGVYSYLSKVIEITDPTDLTIGVLDTVHSKAGWGVSWVCNKLGLTCLDFYPNLKDRHGEPGPNQLEAKKLGAGLVPMAPSRSAILWYRARRIMAEQFPEDGLMMPNALKLSESIEATYQEALLTNKDLFRGTWVFSISSGTIAAGVIRALNDNIDVICHMGYSRPIKSTRKYILEAAKVDRDITFIDEGFEYKAKVDNSWIPFPCNEYYDAKAFTWLCRNIRSFKQPVIFWNVGS